MRYHIQFITDCFYTKKDGYVHPFLIGISGFKKITNFLKKLLTAYVLFGIIVLAAGEQVNKNGFDSSLAK